MSVSSGLSTVRGRESQFLGDAVNRTLNNMSYADLQTLKYNLYLNEVKKLGSVKEFKKKYPNFKIPSPPMSIAGVGGSTPGGPAVPTIVPTRELQLTATPAERQQEIDDIQTLRPSNIYISDFLNDTQRQQPIADISDLPYGYGEGTGLGIPPGPTIYEPIGIPDPGDELIDPRQYPPFDDDMEETKEETKEEIPDEPKPTRGKTVYANTLLQLILKLRTDKRNNILSTEENVKKIEKLFKGNKALINALKKLFLNNGFDLTAVNSTSGQTSAVANEIADNIESMDPNSQQLLINDIAKVLNENDNGAGVIFKVRDMTPQEQPQLQEPDYEEEERMRTEVLKKLRTVMTAPQASNLFDTIYTRIKIIRLKKYAETADWAGSDAETNKAILRIVSEEVKRMRTPNVSTSKIFKILQDSISFLNIIPESTVDKFPDLRMPTTSTSSRDTELEKKAREVIRQAGLQATRAGQALAGFGSYTITTSRALSNRLLRELPFNKKGDLDPNKSGYGLYDPIFGDEPNPDDPDDPDDGPEEVSFRDSTGRIQTVKLTYKQLLALLSAIGLVGGSIKLASKPGENPDDKDGKDDDPEDPPPTEDSGEGGGDIPKKDLTIEELYNKMRITKNEITKLENMIMIGRKNGASNQYLSSLINELEAKKLQYSIVRDAIIAKQAGETDEGGGDGIPPEEGDGGDEKDDPDTEITPPQPIPIEPTDTSEGVRIAQYVDPAEVNLFVSNNAEARAEQRRWEEFSKVLPGFGLGGPNVNPLAKVNAEYYKKQFQNPNQTRKTAKPSIWKKPRGTIYNQPQLINVLDGYEHGKIQFEEDSYHTNRFMSDNLYNPFRQSVSNYNWNNANMNWHPEHKLAGYEFKPTRIPEVRTQPGFEGIPWDYRPSAQNNELIGPYKTGVRDVATRRNDNFSDKPVKVNSNIANYRQNLRVKSTRNR